MNIHCKNLGSLDKKKEKIVKLFLIPSFLESITSNHFTAISAIFCVCVSRTKMRSKCSRAWLFLSKPHTEHTPTSLTFFYKIFFSTIPYHWTHRLFLIWRHYNKFYSEHPCTNCAKNQPDYFFRINSFK